MAIFSKDVLIPFTNKGKKALGLSPVIKIYELGTPDTLVVNDEAMAEVGDGLYKYAYANYDSVKNYGVVADGGGILPFGERFAYGGNESFAQDIAGIIQSGGGPVIDFGN